MMAFAFLESLLVTGVLVLLSAMLPSNWLRDGFIYKGLIIVGMMSLASIILQRTMQGDLPTLAVLTLIWFTPLVWASVFIILAQRSPRVQSILREIAERMSIMLFLYLPIGFLSLMVIVFRILL